jgi:hypothetical protein
MRGSVGTQLILGERDQRHSDATDLILLLLFGGGCYYVYGPYGGIGIGGIILIILANTSLLFSG